MRKKTRGGGKLVWLLPGSMDGTFLINVLNQQHDDWLAA